MKRPLLPPKKLLKQVIYVEEDMMEELRHEARRQECTHGWLMGKAWELARAEIKKLRAP